MANARQRRRRRRIWDHAKMEVAERCTTRSAESRAGRTSGTALQVKPMTRTQVRQWLRKEGLRPEDLIEIADIKIPGCPGRASKDVAPKFATGGKPVPPSLPRSSSRSI